jgi:hypothetical protein
VSAEESPTVPPSTPFPPTTTFHDLVRSERIRKASIRLLVVLGAAWIVVRFCGLGTSPPGFFMDEATPATNAMCLAETGRNVQGERWPLYSPAAGGGSHTLVLLAFDTVWIKVFGTSRESFRAVSGFFILLTSLGLVLIARDAAKLIPAASERADQDTRSAFPWLALFAALVSPWAFHFSRIAWDAPVASAFMIWSVAAVLRSYRADRASFWWSLVAGACAALSMIAYAPLRAVVPLVLPLEVVLLWLITPSWPDRWRLLRNMLFAGVTATALLASTIRMLLDGKINERMNNIVIWRPDWMRERAASTPHWRFLVETFLDNLVAHLKPSFLFFDGDAGLRHSPHISGQLSPIDMLALAVVASVVILATVRTIRGTRQGLHPSISLSETTRWMLAIALAAGLCWLFGLVPSALTFDAIPHAIRSLAAWPFIALFTGAILAIAWSRLRWFAPVLALLALAYTIYYFPAYFRAYDGAASYWFMRDMTDIIAKERREQPGKTIPQIVSDHFGYSYYYDEIPWFYLMSEGHLGCAEAGDMVHALRKAAQ